MFTDLHIQAFKIIKVLNMRARNQFQWV